MGAEFHDIFVRRKIVYPRSFRNKNSDAKKQENSDDKKVKIQRFLPSAKL